MKTKRRASCWQRRLWAVALAAGLVCALFGTTASAVQFTPGAEPSIAAPKPTVSIVGNLVVDKNKPTGFYELSLRVKTARTITKDGVAVDEAEYLAALEDDAKDGGSRADAYVVTNYPFQSAAAAVQINLDALAAVTWGAGKPIYDDWDDTTKSYKTTALDTGYPRGPRGIDLDNKDQPKIFTDLAPLITGGARAVRLDTANPDMVTTAEAFIERYDPATHTALLTLSAATTATSNVVYNTETPVVVVRFAYDMERFPDWSLEKGTPNFWAGVDRADGAGRTQVTYLGDSDLGNLVDGPFSKSDAQAAESSVHQSVWYTQNIKSDDVAQETASFYYYLGAETLDTAGTNKFWVYEDETMKEVGPIAVPKTEGAAVLAKRGGLPFETLAGDPEPGEEYSFLQNLLTATKDGTLKVRLVNEETYRKPTGAGGTTILFYDWDDKFIGSLVVDKGDVRAEVEDYIEENLVHPDLRPGKQLEKMGGKLPDNNNFDVNADAQNYKTLVNSLARDYTYRGKYAYTVGDPDEIGPDGDTTKKARENGEDYPLTNKLDYVFTKRVNTALARTVEDDPANNVSHTETYVLPHKVTDADMQDAALYPYAYGWAVVEDTSEKNKTGWKTMYDAARIESTWTTIGVGELTDVDPDYYEGSSVVGKPLTQQPGDVYQAPLFLSDADPGWLDLAEKEDPSGTYTDRYAYQLNSNGAEKYFRFADFSDIDAELARYKKTNGTNKDTLIVKAVYEPGESLLENIYYRLYEDPAYNKLNDLSASNGGAYSVGITLERATDDMGSVQGVSRMRQPAVRQDTTVDQKWIQDNALGVDHDLSNPSISTAKQLTETTFTKVDVDNGERVSFTMSLSARQNKVDYYIIEQYGNNFVSGAQRSLTNYNRTGTAHTIDNYNYFANGDSDEKDEYYDPKDYADREGSRGFVLYGTLNNLMQIATWYNNNEITSIRLNQVIEYQNMRDANLRSDNVGTLAAPNNEGGLQNKILDAARECQDKHYGEPDFWNNDLDCAELTYHQLQLYIIESRLRTRADADASKIPFCHLHAACADLLSDKPRTWEDLLKAIDDGAPERIDQLTLTEIEEMTHLRTSRTGGAFGNVSIFKARFNNAVLAGNRDWVSIQRHIIDEGDVDTFWWFDGATSNPAPGNLAALGDRAQSALHAQKYPDGQERQSFAKLESARAAFDQNAAAGDNKTATAWVRMTNNLVKDHQETEVGEGDEMEIVYTHTKYDTFEDFRDAYLAALRKAEADGFGYGDGLTTPTWEGIQHAILHPAGSYDNAADGTDDAEFWWKDGKTPLKVVNIKTLLEAARLAQSADEDEKALGEKALGKVTLEMLAGEPYYLRSSMKGAPLYDPNDPSVGYATIEDLLTKVKSAQSAGATDWNSLQYYLIYDRLPEDTKEITAEAFYYWWKGGGTGTAIDFTGATLNTVIPLLQEAALRGDEFGDPAAKDSVEAQISPEGNFFDLTRLITSYDTENDLKLEDIEGKSHASTDALLQGITAMTEFMKTKQGITDPYTLPEVTWHQVQYWILHYDDEDPYIEYGSDAYKQAVEDYWWYDKDEKPEDKKPYEPSDGLADAILAWCTDGNDSTLKGTITFTNLWKTYGIYTSKTGGKYTNKTIATGKTRLLNLAKAVKASDYYDAEKNKLTLYWAQIQYYWVTQTLVDNKTALTAIVNEWNWTKVESGGGNEFIPKEVDLSGI